MPNPKLEKLTKLLELLKTDTITPAEIEKFLALVLKVIKDANDNFTNLSQQNLEAISTALESIQKQCEEASKCAKEDISSYTSNEKQSLISDLQNTLNEATAEVARLKSFVPKNGTPGKDGKDGKDADEQKILADLLAQVKLPEYKETVLDNAEQIITKINDLPSDSEFQIDVSRIKGLPSQKNLVTGARYLQNLVDVAITSPTNNQVLKYNSTTGRWENGAGGAGASPLTTKGDLYGFSTLDARIPVGADGTVLTADSTQALGVKWAAVSGTGTVTTVSVVTANGVSGSVANPTTTPAITLTLGAITPTTVNSITLSGSATPTLAVTGTSAISGTNTGDQTITLTGEVTGSGTGSFAATLTNSAVIGKVLTGYVSGAGTVAATDTILQAIQKLNGNDATNANLTGVITSVGNATSIASQTGTGTKFVVDTSPTLVTPNIGVATATSINKVTITQPATSATLTVADGKTLTSSFNATFNGADQTFTGSGTAVTTFPNENSTLAGVVGSDRAVAQTAAKTLATYTLGAADASFLVSANVLVTTSTTHAFTVTVSYTDEGNTARVLTLQFSSLAGAFVTSIANAAGAVPYEGSPVHIRCKASTTIIVASTGTFTTVTYNIEERIVKL